MQDIQDAEADSIRDLTRFLDVELDYHERCAETLRQTRANWTADASGGSPVDSYGGSARRPSARSRSNTAQGASSFSRSASYSHDHVPSAYEEPDEIPNTHMRVPIRSQSRISNSSAASSGAATHRERDRSPAAQPLRPTVSRSSTYSISRTPSAGLSVVPPPAMNNVASLRGQLRPTARPAAMDVFRDDGDDTESSDTPPGSASPATSYSSSSRTNLSNGAGALGKKAPPPPPNRAKKPAPPVPNRRERDV